LDRHSTHRRNAVACRKLNRGKTPAAGSIPRRAIIGGEDSNQLPTKATKEVPPELLSLFRKKKMPKHSPILVRI